MAATSSTEDPYGWADPGRPSGPGTRPPGTPQPTVGHTSLPGALVLVAVLAAGCTTAGPSRPRDLRHRLVRPSRRGAGPNPTGRHLVG